MSLTAPERETIITMNDEDGFAEIWSAQRPIITKLKKNPSATLFEEGMYGSSAWARFRLPADRQLPFKADEAGSHPRAAKSRH
jgi:hypothetical protein